MGYWEGVFTGMLVGSVMGVVATVGAEVAVACLAYAVYRALIRLGLIKTQTVESKSSLVELA